MRKPLSIQLFLLYMSCIWGLSLTAVFIDKKRLCIDMYGRQSRISAFGDLHSASYDMEHGQNQGQKIIDQITEVKKRDPKKKIAYFAEVAGRQLFTGPINFIFHNAVALFDNGAKANRERANYLNLVGSLFRPGAYPCLKEWENERSELNGVKTEPVKDATLGQVKQEFNQWATWVKNYCHNSDRSLPHIRAIERRLNKAERMYTRADTVLHTLKMTSETSILTAARILDSVPVIRNLFQKKQYKRVHDASARLFDACIGCDFDHAIKNKLYDHIVYCAGRFHTKWLADKFFKENIVRRDDCGGGGFLTSDQDLRITWDDELPVKRHLHTQKKKPDQHNNTPPVLLKPLLMVPSLVASLFDAKRTQQPPSVPVRKHIPKPAVPVRKHTPQAMAA